MNGAIAACRPLRKKGWEAALHVAVTALLLCGCAGDGGLVRDADEPIPVPTPFPPLLPRSDRAGMSPGQSMTDDGTVVLKGARIRATGAGWARVNFRLGPHASSADPAWIAAYDQIVDDFISNGVQVLGLIGAESVYSDASHGSDGWIDDYAAEFVRIVDHFKDRVRVYESYNEPNNWAPGTSQPVLSAHTFAKLLQRVYLEVKHFNGHAADPAWQVTLVSGPLFSFDLTDASDYMNDVYVAGRTQLAWDWTCQETGSFPLDALGYHVYVQETPDASEQQVIDALRGNVDGLTAVSDAQEGFCAPLRRKEVWITEVGFNADSTTEPVQARNVAPLFEAWRDDWRVPVFFWFTLDDFPGGPWGLFRLDGSPRPAYAAFQQATADDRADP